MKVNKSHAAAYAANSYYTAWLKYYYPSEFLASALNFAEVNKIPGLLADAREMGIKILLPSINYSEEGFSVTEDGSIRFGLSAVKSVGSNAKEIIQERNERGLFDNLCDFFMRTETKKNAVENLMWAGAFDDFSKNRTAMVSIIEAYKTVQQKRKAKETLLVELKAILPYIDYIDTEEGLRQAEKDLNIRHPLTWPVNRDKLIKKIDNAELALQDLDFQIGNIIVPTDVKEDSEKRLAKEHEYIGTYVTSHPLDFYTVRNPKTKAKLTKVGELTGGENVKVMAVITSIEVKNRKSDGVPFALINIEDKTGSIEGIIYASTYQSVKNRLKEGGVYVFDGFVREEGTGVVDDSGIEQTTLSFSVSAAEDTVLIQDETIIWPMHEKLYAKFMNRKDDFIKKYGSESEDSCAFAIQHLDDDKSRIERFDFRVSPEVKSLSEVIYSTAK